MKLLSIFLLVLLIGSSQALAIAPVNLASIQEAQDYGKISAQKEYTEFLSPWMSYEENAVKLDAGSERAYLYTPFLLMAVDARDKTRKGQDVDVQDSGKILEAYNGYLIFSAVVQSDDPAFGSSVTAYAKQDKNRIAASQSVVPEKPLANTWSKTGPAYMLQCYFYFNEQDFKNRNPIVLTVKMADKRERHFYFALQTIK